MEDVRLYDGLWVRLVVVVVQLSARRQDGRMIELR